MDAQFEVGEEHGNSKEESVKKKMWRESKKMWKVGGPAILVPFSTFGVHVVSQAFIGQLSATNLAAYSLVCNVLFRFVLGIQLGMVGGMGTLCGQAYGAKQYQKLGIFLQQSWMILVAASTLLTPIFVFAAPILKALRQDHRIAEMAGTTTALWFIPMMFLYAVLQCFNTFLQSQSKNFLLSCLVLLCLLLHVFASWLLTAKLELGVPGVMASAVSAYLIPNAVQVVHLMCGGCRETWNGFTALAFRDLGPAIKLSLSSAAMLCLDFCYNIILVLLTGNMKNAEVKIDALSICLNISGWAAIISFGFMAAASVRVSNELGRRDAKAAKFSIIVILVTSVFVGLVLSVFVLLFKQQVARVFTTDEDVAEAVSRLSPLLAFSLLLSSVQGVLAGVASGVGRQGSVAYINLGCYYLIGIPLGVVLGYVVLKQQVEGIWMGMMIGSAAQTAMLVILTCKTDWNEQPMWYYHVMDRLEDSFCY
ncbi:MATE efflux family protein [Perilla frutescens var. hirtella]|uniref:Protein DETOXIFICATION n=1 Tax=Perilla frutescens var. hirtella TaxID=608512 RepID=A0AAD4J5T9_PERFH|nr:MATE efflux family protein [Perilla frutescens var. hirtella]